MFGGRALGYMAGTLIWMPACRACAGQPLPHRMPLVTPVWPTVNKWKATLLSFFFPVPRD